MCKDCKDSEPYTKEQYDELKASLEAKGFTVVTKYRKGLKHIKLGDLVLSEQSNDK